MKGGRGPKAKGNTHERAMAKALSAWWGKPFQRSPNSGALRWGGSFWTYGDLVPPEDCPLVVECKHYREIDLQVLLGGSVQPSNILGWWSQARADAQRCRAETQRRVAPVLIPRSNRKEPLVMTGFRLPDALRGWREDTGKFWLGPLGSLLVIQPGEIQSIVAMESQIG